jgi:hypothetical protein
MGANSCSRQACCVVCSLAVVVIAIAASWLLNDANLLWGTASVVAAMGFLVHGKRPPTQTQSAPPRAKARRERVDKPPSAGTAGSPERRLPPANRG